MIIFLTSKSPPKMYIHIHLFRFHAAYIFH